jgi:pimeloyl-ACP methyl ester carboxylesterase
MFQVPLLCFSSAIQENDELTDVSPDSEFHADTFIKLKEGITAYKVIEPKISFTEENTGVIQTIVCLHGLYNSSYMWADLVDLLTDFDQGPMSRVLILDFYGRGRSPWTGVPITLDVLVNQVKELIDGIEYF